MFWAETYPVLSSYKIKSPKLAIARGFKARVWPQLTKNKFISSVFSPDVLWQWGSCYFSSETIGRRQSQNENSHLGHSAPNHLRPVNHKNRIIIKTIKLFNTHLLVSYCIEKREIIVPNYVLHKKLLFVYICTRSCLYSVVFMSLYSKQ